MAATDEDLDARVAALEKMIAERPTREEVEEIVEHSREEIHNAAAEAINSVVEASKKSINELQQAGIDGVQQVADSVGGISEKLDSLSEKVNKLLGAYDLGKWIAAIVLGGLGYGIYHISDKLSDIIALLGKLADG